MIYIVKHVYATTFEPQGLAYPPADAYQKNPKIEMVALPYSFGTFKKPRNRRIWVGMLYRGRSAMSYPGDVGPYHTNDPFWSLGRRPLIEAKNALYVAGVRTDDVRTDSWEIVDGKKTGLHLFALTPASIDLTPALWVKLGVPEKVAYGMNFSDWLDAIAIVDLDETD